MTDDHDSGTKYKWEFWFCEISMYVHWTITLLAHKDQTF